VNKHIYRFLYQLILILLITGILTNAAIAQDPGFPDSVIFVGDTIVAYNPGFLSYYDLRVFCVTDDSILFANIPLKWSGDASQIYPVEIFWENTFGAWEHGANYSGSNHLSLYASAGFGHNYPPLYTNYQRESEVLIRYAISPTALPQVVVIDTATDSISGKIEFANIEVTFRPKFRGAHFRYGEPGQTVEGIDASAGRFTLKGCYPNPFNSSAMIAFELSEAARCQLIIYDILGREIAYLIDEELSEGHYAIDWGGKSESGDNSGSGVYFIRLTANGKTQIGRLTLIR